MNLIHREAYPGSESAFARAFSRKYRDGLDPPCQMCFQGQFIRQIYLRYPPVTSSSEEELF